MFLKNLRYYIQTAWSTTGAVLCSLVTKSCLTLCNLMNCSPPDSAVHGILQARLWGGLPFPSPKVSSQPRDRADVSCSAGRFFPIWATREALININSKLSWSCLPAWDLHVSAPLFFSLPCYIHPLERPQSFLIPDITKGEFPSPSALFSDGLNAWPFSIWPCHKGTTSFSGTLRGTVRLSFLFAWLLFSFPPNFSASVLETATLPCRHSHPLLCGSLSWWGCGFQSAREHFLRWKTCLW